MWGEEEEKMRHDCGDGAICWTRECAEGRGLFSLKYVVFEAPPGSLFGKRTWG